MFADWELIGVPYRVVIGERGLKEGQLEFQARTDTEATNVSVAEVANKVIDSVKAKLAIN
jgi:prolyl-tRNA synthetase